MFDSFDLGKASLNSSSDVSVDSFSVEKFLPDSFSVSLLELAMLGSFGIEKEQLSSGGTFWIDSFTSLSEFCSLILSYFMQKSVAKIPKKFSGSVSHLPEKCSGTLVAN